MRRTPGSPSVRWICSHSVPMWSPAKWARRSNASVLLGVRLGRSRPLGAYDSNEFAAAVLAAIRE